MENKKYIVLYYLAFVITLFFTIFASYKYLELISIGDGIYYGLLSEVVDGVLVIINIVLVIIFTILLIKKKKIKVNNILYPIFYMSFFAIVVVMCFLFNSKVIVPYIHFEYYLFFINIGYLFLNGYSLVLISNKK